MYKKVRWRTLPYTNGFYQISDQGEVRKISKFANTYSIQSISMPKYSILEFERTEYFYSNTQFECPVLRYRSEFGLEQKAISILMYEAFHGIYHLTNEDIIHLDGNEFNNELKNLILATKSDRMHYMLSLKRKDAYSYIPIVQSDGSKGYSKTISKVPLSLYNLEGNLIKIFPSIVQASLDLNIDRNQIYKVLYGIKGHDFEGMIYKLGYGPIEIDTHLIKNKKIVIYNSSSSLSNKLVFQYSTTGKLMSVFNNLIEASFKNNLPLENLQSAINNTFTLNNSVWLYG